MKLTEHIYLVGSGRMGFSLTDPLDCHVYLVQNAGDAVLIDAGGGVDVTPILAEIARDGIDPGSIRRLLLTHAHADHAGGAAALAEALRLEIHASALAADYLGWGDERAISLDRARAAGAYPPDYVFRAAPVAGVLSEGDHLAVGDLTLEVLETPGHCGGHLSFALHRPGGVDLFCGDALFAQGAIILQDIWDCTVGDSCRSVKKIAALRPDGFFPGHGAVSIARGWTHAEAALERISQLLPPRNLA
ncbi:MAG: MBL fold metallo-hydrolase [Thermomicrobiales bacterium]